MLIAGFDTETTGLNVAEDHIIQVALVLWDTEAKINKAKIMFTSLIKGDHIPNVDVISPEALAMGLKPASEIHGITQEDLEKYGNSPQFVFKIINGLMLQADAVCAHNGNMFDKPIYESNCARHSLAPRAKAVDRYDVRHRVPAAHSGAQARASRV
jgi:DNA polymerase III epsilon subunit-like protein